MTIEVAVRCLGYFGIVMAVWLTTYLVVGLFLIWWQSRQLKKRAKESIRQYVEDLQKTRREADELEAMMGFQDMLDAQVNVKPQPKMWN